MVNKRHPQICRFILRSIVTDDPPQAALRLSGFHPPSWEELAEGLRPGRRAIEDEDRLAKAHSREFGTGFPGECVPTTFDPQPFRVLMLRRIHLPLPLSISNCRCGRPLDSLGHHRAACAVAGVLGRMGFTLESAAARVCLAGA